MRQVQPWTLPAPPHTPALDAGDSCTTPQSISASPKGLPSPGQHRAPQEPLLPAQGAGRTHPKQIALATVAAAFQQAETSAWPGPPGAAPQALTSDPLQRGEVTFGLDGEATVPSEPSRARAHGRCQVWVLPTLPVALKCLGRRVGPGLVGSWIGESGSGDEKPVTSFSSQGSSGVSQGSC